MKTGDLVRFRKEWHQRPERSNCLPVWFHGILIEYHTWEKIATILYEGREIRVAARNVQLASRAKEEI